MDTDPAKLNPATTTPSFSRSAGAVPQLSVLPETTSTNDVLREIWLNQSEDPTITGETIPESFTTVVSDKQTACRGRLHRSWVMIPGKCLGVSTLITVPDTAAIRESLGWLAPIAALALRDAVLQAGASRQSVAEDSRADRDINWDLTIKWPNDVLLNGSKLAGILGEVFSSRNGQLGCVVGTGVNLNLSKAELPTAQATSLLVEGLDVMSESDKDSLLYSYLISLRHRMERFITAEGSPHKSGLYDEFTKHCSTLNSQVRAIFPNGTVLTGKAVSLSPQGHLEIITPEGDSHVVAAADIEHLRPQ